MDLKQLDKTKAKVGALTTVIGIFLEIVLSSITGFIYYTGGTGLFRYFFIAICQVVLTAVVFVGGYLITTNFFVKIKKVKMKDVWEMAFVTGLFIIAFQRAFNMLFGYSFITTLCAWISLFLGAYFLVPDVEDNEVAVSEKTTLYRKEKIIQDGSKAASWMNYIYVYAWAAGLIFTLGGFIVKPRSQAPGFYAIGLVFLVLAFVWTKQKMESSSIESYKKIVLPANWPSDCSYEKYHEGLHTRVAKTSGGLLGDKNMKFYEKCVSQGVTSISNEYNEQKALKIAEVMKIQDANLEMLKEMFETGKTMCETDAKNASEASAMNAINVRRIAELNELAECMKYYGYSGIEKRKAMLKDLAAEAKKEASDAEMRGQMVSRTMLQKEHDWATHGGIASGIAGPAAGVATALDIQAKNAAIREQNAKMMPYVAYVTSAYANDAQGYRAQYEKYTQDLKATNTKLVSSDSKEKVMENLCIEDAKYEVTSTGAVRVSATFSMNPEYRIFDSMKPTIDGCVAARLMKGKTCVGSAYFVFPVEGMIGKRSLSAICTKTTDPKAKYELKFEADNLWSMETL